MTQICADAIGVDISSIVTLGADTDATPDAGRAPRRGRQSSPGTPPTSHRPRSASGCSSSPARRTGAHRAGTVRDWSSTTADEIDDGGHLARWMPTRRDLVAVTSATYDPPTTALDEDGQGEPYAQFGYGRTWLRSRSTSRSGRCGLRRITAAHDVGRAVNPTLIEGQIEGGVAQGIGMALMEEYLPGRNENLHDYLIPTIGDVPEMVEHPDRVRRPRRSVRGEGHRGARARPHGAGDPERGPRRGRCRRAPPAGPPDRVLAAIAEGATGVNESATDTVVCDACPIRCVIKPGRTGSCDRYGNVDGASRALEPLQCWTAHGSREARWCRSRRATATGMASWCRRETCS